MNYAGLEIHTNPMLVVPGKPFTVRRSLKERWLSWPWRPWRATKIVVPMVPDRTAYRTGNIVYMHPAMARELREAIPPARSNTYDANPSGGNTNDAK